MVGYMNTNNNLYTILGSSLIKISKTCSSYEETVIYARSHKDMVLVVVNGGLGHFCELKELETIETSLAYTTQGTFVEELIRTQRRN